ncbi:MAG: NDP-sugar synthase [Actinomycetia bacterium]|nr:NDP-sugar synthase [Actinomycetes bacterium]
MSSSIAAALVPDLGIVEAIMLVGGKGTRLRPLTINTPKPMLPVAGVPFTAHQLAQAADAGVTRVILGTSYRPEVFSAYFGDGSDMRIELVYRTEEVPLGTGGGIRFAAEALESGPDDPVLVFNGDVLSGVDLPSLIKSHQDTQAAVTLFLTRVADPSAFGLVPTDAQGAVLDFLEKPQTPEEIVTDQINAGCYVFQRSVIDEIPADRPVSVEREVFPDLLAQGRRVTGVVDDGYWLDLGTPMSFVQGSADLVLGRVRSSAVPGPVGPSLCLPGSQVSPSADVTGGSVIGSGAQVGAGAKVVGSVVMAGARIEDSARVINSVVAGDAVIGETAVVRGSVVAEGAVVGAGNELTDGARIWPEMTLPPHSIRFSSDR